MNRRIAPAPSRRRFLKALAALGLPPLAGCRDRAETAFLEEGFLVFNAPVMLKFAETPPSKALALIEQAQAWMQPFYERIHPWKDSALTRFNRQLREQGEASTTPELRALIQEARTLSEQTEGQFNPAAGELVAMWGFHSSDPGRDRQPPDAAALRAWRDNPPDMRQLRLEGDRAIADHPRLQLDFNAMAEGVAARHIHELARGLGIRNLVFDPGGDLSLMGGAGPRPWNLAIQDPFSTRPAPLASIALEGEWALYSSGSYQRRFVFDGRHYSHILDPRSGWPAADTVASTVLHPDPVTADAAATAMVVAGPANAPRLAQRLGLAGYLLVTAERHVYLSENWRDALRFGDQSYPVTLLPS